MPFSGTEAALAAKIDTELTAEFPIGLRDIDPADRLRASEAIARAIIDHLTTESLTVIGTCPPAGGPLTGGKLV
jgi:hypothetical protein